MNRRTVFKLLAAVPAAIAAMANPAKPAAYAGPERRVIRNNIVVNSVFEEIPSQYITTCNANNNVYYVSTGGCDSNCGSINLPWRTLDRAVNGL